LYFVCIFGRILTTQSSSTGRQDAGVLHVRVPVGVRDPMRFGTHDRCGRSTKPGGGWNGPENGGGAEGFGHRFDIRGICQIDDRPDRTDQQPSITE